MGVHNYRRFPSRVIATLLEDIEMAIIDSDKDLEEELVVSIGLLESEFEESFKRLVNEAAAERNDLWIEKEKVLWDTEEEHVHKRRAAWTGVLCSGVATLIAEYITGVPEIYYGHDGDAARSEDLYAFALAIRVDGEKWHYLTKWAMWMTDLCLTFSWAHSSVISSIARPIIGEMCRMEGIMASRKSVQRLLDLPKKPKKSMLVTDMIQWGLACKGVSWFSDHYLKSPPLYEKASKEWDNRLSVSAPSWGSCRQPELIEYVKEKLTDAQPTRFELAREAMATAHWLPPKWHW